MQNGYARTGGVEEQVELGVLITEAIALGCPDPERHGIEIHEDVPTYDLTLDRHRVLQILVNLLANARDSVTAHLRSGATSALRVSVTAVVEAEWLEVRVADTGGGIAPASLCKIFNAGFTTKPRGHGYGLHSSALAAEQLGGTLRCTSEGLGRGAIFVLRVPIARRG
jgi:signal transduction histidine kinase